MAARIRSFTVHPGTGSFVEVEFRTRGPARRVRIKVDAEPLDACTAAVAAAVAAAEEKVVAEKPQATTDAVAELLRVEAMIAERREQLRAIDGMIATKTEAAERTK